MYPWAQLIGRGGGGGEEEKKVEAEQRAIHTPNSLTSHCISFFFSQLNNFQRLRILMTCGYRCWLFVDDVVYIRGLSLKQMVHICKPIKMLFCPGPIEQLLFEERLPGLTRSRDWDLLVGSTQQLHIPRETKRWIESKENQVRLTKTVIRGQLSQLFYVGFRSHFFW